MNRDMLQYMAIVDEFNKDIHIKKFEFIKLNKEV